VEMPGEAARVSAAPLRTGEGGRRVSVWPEWDPIPGVDDDEPEDDDSEA
jgi:hypothetical protein